MSFLQGVAMGMVKRANAVSRQRAIDNRDKRIRDEENRNQIGLSLANGVIAGDVRPETYNLFIGSNAKFEDIVPNLADDRKYFDELVKQKEHKEAGFKYLQTLAEAGIVPAEVLGNAIDEDWGIDKYYDTATKYVTIDNSTEAYEANVEAKTEMFANKDIREAYQGPDPAIVIADMEFTRADILSMSMNMSEQENIISINAQGSVLELPIADDDSDIDKRTENQMANLNQYLFNDRNYDTLIQQATANSALAESTLEFIDGQLNAIKTSSFTKSKIQMAREGGSGEGIVRNFTEFSKLLSFKKDLETIVNKPASSQASQVETMTPQRQVGDFVFTQSATSDGNSVIGKVNFTSDQTTSIQSMSGAMGMNSKDFIENVAVNGLHSNQGDRNVDLFKRDSIPLYKLTNGKVLDIFTGGGDEATRQMVIKYLNEKAGDDTTRKLEILMPFIPRNDAIRGLSEDIAIEEPDITMTAKEAFEGQDVDLAKVREKNEFSKKAVGLFDIIIENMGFTEDKGDYVKVGGAGALQRLNVGLLGEGSQLDLIFGGLSSDDLTPNDDGTITTIASLQDAAMEVFNDNNIDVTLTQKLGEVEVSVIQLAYALARAEDSNGRLSDADFKIQLDQLIGQGLFANQNVILSKLRTRRTQMANLSAETEYFTKFAGRRVGPRELRQIDGYNRIVSESNKIHRTSANIRNKKKSASSTSDSFAALVQKGYLEKIPSFQQKGYEFYQDKNSMRLLRRDITDDSLVNIQGITAYRKENPDFQSTSLRNVSSNLPPKPKDPPEPVEDVPQTITGRQLTAQGISLSNRITIGDNTYERGLFTGGDYTYTLIPDNSTNQQ
tara:strand:- start:67 stop:2580 length:2514 start_codon:yes stop_codon:yes gene_type:complete